ncbi:hypothetical protein [Actinoalloteichus spitiensis]|nr:hypothetical protein [Actinoalloteichus spitiensis]
MSRTIAKCRSDDRAHEVSTGTRQHPGPDRWGGHHPARSCAHGTLLA